MGFSLLLCCECIHKGETPMGAALSRHDRRMTTWLTLLLYLAAMALPLLLPVIHTSGSGLSFPCAGHGCACATAQQCLSDCCCFPAAPVQMSCHETAPVETAASVLLQAGCQGSTDDELAAPVLTTSHLPSYASSAARTHSCESAGVASAELPSDPHPYRLDKIPITTA